MLKLLKNCEVLVYFPQNSCIKYLSVILLLFLKTIDYRLHNIENTRDVSGGHQLNLSDRRLPFWQGSTIRPIPKNIIRSMSHMQYCVTHYYTLQYGNIYNVSKIILILYLYSIYYIIILLILCHLFILSSYLNFCIQMLCL